MKLNIHNTYNVLKHARRIANDDRLEIITLNRKLGEPLALDMKDWLAKCSPSTMACFDFTGVRAVSLSVAETVGPLLMQSVQQSTNLDHRYPIYRLESPEPAYTFGAAFAEKSLNALAVVKATDLSGYNTPIAEIDDERVIVLGDVSNQSAEILRFVDKQHQQQKPTTSEMLTSLEFMMDDKVKAAARSKRLTDLYLRRLLAFTENPSNTKERLFIPAWRLN